MSRLAGLLLVVMGATAFAEPSEPPASPPKPEAVAPAAKSSKFPLRVVKILSDSEQALLFDNNRGRHVLVELGDTIGDYTVSSIDEDQVTLAGKDMPVEVVLAAPQSKAKPTPSKRPAATAATDAAPEDPYGATAAAATRAPADPYDDEDQPIREVTASGESTEKPIDKPIRAAHWGKTDGEKSTTSPFATMDEAAAKPSAEVANPGKAPAPTDAKTTADAPTKLSKKEVNVALADFAALAASIDGSFTATGLKLEKVAGGSVFAKAGLVPGDVVTAIDGKPLRTIDDAADLYARAGSMRSATVQLVRAGKPQTLRIAIQ